MKFLRVILSVFLITVNPPSFANQVFFERHFIINPKVEVWTNLFFSELFDELISDLKINYSEETDVSLGIIKGGFSAVIDSVKEAEASDIKGGFRVYINPNDGKPSEYGLNLEAEFTIEQTDNVFYTLEDLLSFCPVDDHSLFLSLCKTFEAGSLDSNLSKVQNISNSLNIWKGHLIEQLYQIKDPEIQPIKQDFVNWIANHILIEENETSVSLNVDLSGLKAEFADLAEDFFIKTKLVDYFLESIRIQFFEDRISAYIHLKKLHLSDRVKLFVNFAAQLQPIIENEAVAKKMGRALRENISADIGGAIDRLVK